jgi:hypothetical protein
MGTLPDLQVFLVNFYGNLLCYDSVDLLWTVFLSTIVFVGFVGFLVFLFTTMI